MKRLQDPAYLRGEQYRTAANLTARADLHRGYSTNPYGWVRWLYDQIAPRLLGQVLEIGGGPAWLWRENLDRLPPGVRVCCTDFSPGMVATARAALGADTRFRFAVADAQAIPLPAGWAGLAIANHMLYHVPDLPRALRELRRVLAPGGVLLAATNGLSHMNELFELVHAFEPRYANPSRPFTGAFGLDNAGERLAPAFGRVEIRRYPDALWVTDAQPLVDYVLSMESARDSLSPSRAPELARFFQQRIDAHGGIRIGKDAGLAIGYP